ncbi:DUF4136 domain-containing protein [Magnetospirillum sp. UT-4]|uniref:DUF4136 domain-containing protein n=1 Tax=Magnetospirillum sp. UT-4 TaxID=2681467 RepID=UPI0013815D6A|nr:DUF4136 domain-containing protein [Magnetospirillum sp. UT-4]CAA7624369.1 conserved exported hypothetical protein [Magnetospirillum sp. UT-4]
MNRAFALLALLFLAACTTPIVQTDVTRFHTLEAGPGPRSFTILPENGQAGSLEFQRNAELVAAALQARGWRPLPASANADAVVTLGWGLGPAHTVTWQTPSSVWTGTGFGSRSSWYGGGIGFPLGDPFPYWETRSDTRHPKWLSVAILDGPAYRGGQRRVLFEGRAVTERGRQEIAPLMPYLVQGLFTGFPGGSGTTIRVDVPVTGTAP